MPTCIAPFRSASLKAAFRDASYNNLCAYKLTVEDVCKGLSQGLLHGWLDLPRFNIVEYEHYEQVENGDLNWTLPAKFISFASPHDVKRRDNGYPLLAPDDYFDYFRRGGVTDVVRLNNVLYDGARFVRAGFNHHELFFTDGSIPDENIVARWFEMAEAAKGAIAIHCKAGLGRTGSFSFSPPSPQQGFFPHFFRPSITLARLHVGCSSINQFSSVRRRWLRWATTQFHSVQRCHPERDVCVFQRGK